jgi:thioesterase domain-containing protein
MGIALNYSGLELSQVPHASVEAAAISYTKTIASHIRQPSIHLLGHSFGGWIAFDIAIRLKQLNFNIASLTLIDSSAPADNISSREFTQTEVLKQYIEVIEMGADHSLAISESHLASLNFTEAVQMIHRCLVSEAMIAPRSTPDAIRGSIVTFARHLRTGYIPPKPYEGPVTLLLPMDCQQDSAHTEMAENINSWRRWAPDLSVRYSTGNHISMLKRPHVAALANLYTSIYD